MRPSRRCERHSDSDHGFTLIELIIAMTLSLMIGGVVVAALITSLRVSSSTTDEVGDSTDAGLITAFLTRDAQSAGSIVPTTALRNTTVGVSTASTAWDSCSQAPATLVVRFSWIEWSSAQLVENKVVVTYGLTSPDALNPTKKQLTRRLCRNGATTGADIVLGRELALVTATCSPVCTSTTTTPTTMWLDVTSWGTTPVAYQLKATVRGDTQAAPTVSNSAPVPLLALGAGSSVVCPNVNLAGTGVVTVRGDVLVDKLCGAAPITGNVALLQPTGSTRTMAGIVDPFAARAKPSTTCATTGTNPTIGVSASATTVVKYPQPVNITADTVFQAGRFMFCQGLTFTSGRITGTNVLLYIHAGSFEAKAAATVNLTGQTTTDKKMLVWSNQVNTPIKVAGGPSVSNYRGLFYAPTSKMDLSSVLGLNIEGINTQGLTVTGAGQARNRPHSDNHHHTSDARRGSGQRCILEDGCGLGRNRAVYVVGSRSARGTHDEHRGCDRGHPHSVGHIRVRRHDIRCDHDRSVDGCLVDNQSSARNKHILSAQRSGGCRLFDDSCPGRWHSAVYMVRSQRDAARIVNQRRRNDRRNAHACGHVHRHRHRHRRLHERNQKRSTMCSSSVPSSSTVPR